MKWSAERYLRFEDERSRPAHDLLARVPLSAAARVVDLGCGPGNSTAILAERFPDAEVAGVDSSQEMLAAARRRLPSLRFEAADIADWTPPQGVDLLFANAVFQWVPDHLAALARLMGALPPGGVLAIQVPDNHDEPSHRAMRETAADGPWRHRFATPIAREAILPPAAYYERLRPLAAGIDIWRTAYQHVLADVGAIVAWVEGTGLRPFLARLVEGEREAFLAAYRARLARYYRPLADGRVLLAFPRLFVVAARA